MPATTPPHPTFSAPPVYWTANRAIGKALLLRSLRAMRDEGYVYGIIGGIGPQKFYEKCVGAMLIPNSTPGIYKDFLGGMK